MKEYLSDLKFTLGILFIILVVVLYNSSYFFSSEVLSQVQIVDINSSKNERDIDAKL